MLRRGGIKHVSDLALRIVHFDLPESSLDEDNEYGDAHYDGNDQHEDEEV